MGYLADRMGNPVSWVDGSTADKPVILVAAPPGLLEVCWVHEKALEALLDPWA